MLQSCCLHHHVVDAASCTSQNASICLTAFGWQTWQVYRLYLTEERLKTIRFVKYYPCHADLDPFTREHGCLRMQFSQADKVRHEVKMPLRH